MIWAVFGPPEGFAEAQVWPNLAQILLIAQIRPKLVYAICKKIMIYMHQLGGSLEASASYLYSAPFEVVPNMERLQKKHCINMRH